MNSNNEGAANKESSDWDNNHNENQNLVSHKVPNRSNSGSRRRHHRSNSRGFGFNQKITI